MWPFKLENVIHHGMYIMCYPCLFKIFSFSPYWNKKVNPIFCLFNKLLDFFVWLFPVPINEHRSLNCSHIAVTVSEVVLCKAFEGWLESFLRNFFLSFPNKLVNSKVADSLRSGFVFSQMSKVMPRDRITVCSLSLRTPKLDSKGL